MRFAFDTEFIDDGRTIDLLSIGIVADDGREFYCEFDVDHRRASPWVKKNVIAHLDGKAVYSRAVAADLIKKFVGEKPEFWAYYADYDWVALCQLFGTMMDIPKGWPMYCRDVKQLCDMLGNPKLPEQGKGEHHALADARWTLAALRFLDGKRGMSAIQQNQTQEYPRFGGYEELADMSSDVTPCPYCNRQPSVERCEPWSKLDGPQPWYVGCYQGGSREHFIGANGDTQADAMKNWEREVADHRTVR